MKLVFRWMVAFVVAIAAMGTGLADVTSAGPTNYQTFKAEGDVTSNDAYPVTPMKEAFKIGPPISNATGGVEAAYNDDGSLTVLVDANTDYYYFDATRGFYKKGTYDDVVKVGEYVRVNGKYAQVGDGSAYQATAKQVYLPPRTTPPPPPNPVPTSTKDYTLNRHFAAGGAPTQEGTNVVIYSDYFGMVLGNLTFTNNSHVQQVADHHYGKLPIVAMDGYTTFRVQREDGKYRDGTKEETIVRGEPIFVAGRYMWDLNDWRFFAKYVWKPTRPAGTGGSIIFNEHTQLANAGSSPAPGEYQNRAYAGETFGGSSDVDPGPLALTEMSWTYNAGTGQWDYVGNWTATQGQGYGHIGGTLSGSWKPSDGTLTGTLILDEGSGRWAGLTGYGIITAGVGVSPPLGSQPPSTFDGQWQLTVFR